VYELGLSAVRHTNCEREMSWHVLLRIVCKECPGYYLGECSGIAHGERCGAMTWVLISVQDYKSLDAAVMIYDILVNTHTHTHTDSF